MKIKSLIETNPHLKNVREGMQSEAYASALNIISAMLCKTEKDLKRIITNPTEFDLFMSTIMPGILIPCARSHTYLTFALKSHIYSFMDPLYLASFVNNPSDLLKMEHAFAKNFFDLNRLSDEADNFLETLGEIKLKKMFPDWNTFKEYYDCPQHAKFREKIILLLRAHLLHLARHDSGLTYDQYNIYLRPVLDPYNKQPIPLFIFLTKEETAAKPTWAKLFSIRRNTKVKGIDIDIIGSLEDATNAIKRSW